MPFIVNGVCRFTLLQELAGNNVANIIDMRIDTTGSTISREAAIADQAEVIAREWAQDINVNLSDEISLVGVQWLDLDEADGSTGTFTGGGGVVLPNPGGAATPPMPGNVSVLVRKNLEQAGRGRRSGRMYVAGLTEAGTEIDEANTIDPLVVAGFNSAFAQFLSDINQNTVQVDDYDSAMCVVHVSTRDGDGHPLTGTSTDVASLTVDPLLATQRRRLRR